MTTVTKKELIYRIAEHTGQKKVVAKRIVQNFISEMLKELERGNRIEFRDLTELGLSDREGDGRCNCRCHRFNSPRDGLGPWRAAHWPRTVWR